MLLYVYSTWFSVVSTSEFDWLVTLDIWKTVKVCNRKTRIIWPAGWMHWNETTTYNYDNYHGIIMVSTFGMKRVTSDKETFVLMRVTRQIINVRRALETAWVMAAIPWLCTENITASSSGHHENFGSARDEYCPFVTSTNYSGASHVQNVLCTSEEKSRTNYNMNELDIFSVRNAKFSYSITIYRSPFEQYYGMQTALSTGYSPLILHSCVILLFAIPDSGRLSFKPNGDPTPIQWRR